MKRTIKKGTTVRFMNLAHYPSRHNKLAEVVHVFRQDLNSFKYEIRFLDDGSTMGARRFEVWPA